MPTKLMLSPRELADAIEVSESSLRRWVDEGRIEASRTAGGHRRIPVSEAIRLVRETGLPIRRPDLLGLPDLNQAEVAADRSGSPDEAIYHALANGRSDEVQALIVSAYLNGQNLAQICDGPLSHALRRIGELWLHSDEGIFIEHRASDLAVQSLHTIRTLVLPSQRDLVAVGGAPPGDVHTLPSLMAAAVLADEGMQEVNIGADTPVHVLNQAAADNHAKLVWLAFTAPQPPDAIERITREVQQMAAHLSEHGGHIVVGGAQVPASLLGARKPKCLHAVGSMSELAAFARGLRAAASGPPANRPSRSNGQPQPAPAQAELADDDADAGANEN